MAFRATSETAPTRPRQVALRRKGFRRPRRGGTGQIDESSMSARPVIRRAREGEGVTFAGQPLIFLVTGKSTKHTSMFHWTVAPGFSTGLHVHEVQEETFYVLEG